MDSWTRNTGQVSIINDPVKGKVMQFTQGGTISLPSQQAYGVWEFSLNKLIASNLITTYLINSNTQGYPNSSKDYHINLDTVNAVKLWKGDLSSVALLAASAGNYIQINTWYSVRIERTLLGQFTLLIKGGSFTPTSGRGGWTLVSTTGGSGSNPVTDNTYTTSNYFVVSAGIGDMIGGIKMTNEIKQL